MFFRLLSYPGRITGADRKADAVHPACSNLFVQTEIIRRQRAVLCTSNTGLQMSHKFR